MTKSQLIAAINALRRPGDPLLPGSKEALQERLESLKRREVDTKTPPKHQHAATGETRGHVRVNGILAAQMVRELWGASGSARREWDKYEKTHEYQVGKICSECGTFRVLGTGATWEDAFEQAGEIDGR